METPLHVLLVEDDPAHARLVKETVIGLTRMHRLTWVETLEDAFECLAAETVDVVVLDLGLVASDGLETLTQFRGREPRAPVVILSSRDDIETAVEAMRSGAQEYLVKGTFEDASFERVCRYAIERKRIQEFEQLIVGIVGHDLKGPIQVLDLGLGYLETLDLDDAATDMLEGMRGSLESGKRLIADVLDLSTLRVGGDLPYEMELCDVREIVAEAVREARALHPDRAIDFDIYGEPRKLGGDADRLWQLTNNLVRNAVQHSVAKSPIDVAVRFGSDEIIIEVHNDGAAIPEAVVPALFEPLSQADAPDEKQSIGLGLYIVDQIVRAHGGRISLATDDGQGTTFSVHLPSQAPRRRRPAE